MKQFFIQFKPFFTFLVVFFASYLVLYFCYTKVYLEQYDSAKNQIDSITKSVANQTEFVLKIFNQNIQTIDNTDEASVRLVLNNVYVARVVEGCNAVSVILLFVSFIVAFSTTFKRTFLFIFVGILIIHILNIARIALLTWALYHYPNQQKLLHDIIFPLFIYGVVFVLWLVWLHKFSMYAQQK